MTRIAVIAFPGTNCMFETAAAIDAAGGNALVLRWNESLHACRGFDGYVLAGGFAYEDRVRAGVIASKHVIVDVVQEAAEAGKPVLGVCNGAQVLVEAGLVPAVHPGKVEVALARNRVSGWAGYYCGWVSLQGGATRGFLRELAEEGPIPMPVGHGEGRFTGDEALFARLAANGQIPLRYVDTAGGKAVGFPCDPNGSLQHAAALGNERGNVVAMMPHPERAAWLYQVPETLGGPWGERRRRATGEQLLGAGPGRVLYEAFVRAARGLTVET